jgi:hypothetical protein
MTTTLISVTDTCGTTIGSWVTSSEFPTLPPQFTYPNTDPKAAFRIIFRWNGGTYVVPLAVGININQAIAAAIFNFITAYAIS